MIRARSSRAQDDELLRMIQMRCDGVSSYEIAALYGVSNTLVRTKTNRVLEADLAESGEWGKAVQSRYWVR